MRIPFILLLLATLPLSSQQQDYTTQLKNKPLNVVATTSLSAAVSSVLTGGTVVVPALSVFTLSSTVTISKTLTLQCEPGGVIQAGANSVTLLTVAASNVTIQGCNLKGNSKTGVVAIVTSSGTNLTVQYNAFSGLATGVNIPSGTLSGNYYGGVNSFSTVSSIGTYVGNNSTSATSVSNFRSVAESYYNFTADDAIHIFQGNKALHSSIWIDKISCIKMAKTCIEADTGGAQTFKVTNFHMQDWSNNGASAYDAGISVAMIDGLYPSGDLDGDIEISNGTIGDATYSGHGLGMEIFSNHLHIKDVAVSSTWASCLHLGGGGLIDGLECSGATVGITQDNSVAPPSSIKVVNSKFSENCTQDAAIYAADFSFVNNTFSRTPGACASDSSTAFKAINAGAQQSSPSLTGTGIIKDNHFTINAGAVPGSFTYTAIYDSQRPGGYITAVGNHFYGHTAAGAFGAAFRSANITVGDTYFYNFATIGSITNALYYYNNVDLSGSLSSDGLNYILVPGSPSAPTVACGTNVSCNLSGTSGNRTGSLYYTMGADITAANIAVITFPSPLSRSVAEVCVVNNGGTTRSGLGMAISTVSGTNDTGTIYADATLTLANHSSGSVRYNCSIEGSTPTTP